MFGRSKPVVLESYGSRRKRGYPPRWLVLLVSGIALGAVGLVVLQERYLPPRLTPTESAKLRTAFESADAERQRLAHDLSEATQKLSTALTEKAALADQLDASRKSNQQLHDDLSAVVDALPPDPRGGTVEVRAGRFTTKSGMLVYDVVLTRERAGSRPFNGVLQLTVAGVPSRGPETTVALKPVPLSMGSYEVVRGSQALPDGFQPRETVVRVLDRAAGNSLGMRVMLVK